MRRLAILGAAAVTVSIAACGGSLRSFAPFGPALFDGSYHVVRFGSTLGGGTSNAMSGRFDVDGASGGLLADQIENVDATLSAPPDAAFSYTVDGYGVMSLSSLPPAMLGGIDARGDCAVFGVLQSFQDPAFLVALKREGTYSDASFAGEYHYAYVFEDGTGWGEATADGSGGVDYAAHNVNTSGTESTAAAQLGLAYAVAADGQMTLDFAGAQLAGGVVAGGIRGMLAGDADVAGGTAEPMAFTFLRHATEASALLFRGRYWFSGMGFSNGQARSLVGLLDADGVGEVILEFSQNLEGAISNSGAQFGSSFTVTANGRLEILAPSGTRYRGALSADGSSAFVAGGRETGDERLFLVFCRRE